MANFIVAADLKDLGYKDYPPDSVLTSMCDKVTAFINNFCNQPILKTLTTEFIDVRFSARDLNKLFPSYLPLISVESLKMCPSLQTTIDVPLTSYQIDNRLGCVLLDKGYYGRIRISYYSGYETVPNDIKQAAIIIASNLISDYIKRENINMDDVVKVKDENQELQFSQDIKSTDISSAARKLLLNYRKIR